MVGNLPNRRDKVNNKYKIMLATIYAAGSVFFFALANDCPDTANYVYCKIDVGGLHWLIIAILLAPMAICTAASVRLSWSDEDEK